MSSTAVGYHNARRGEAEARRQTSAARRREAEAQARIDADLGVVRSNFGMGEDLSEIESLLAGVNQQRSTIASATTAPPPTSTQTAMPSGSGGAGWRGLGRRGLNQGRTRGSSSANPLFGSNRVPGPTRQLADLDKQMRSLNQRKATAMSAQDNKRRMDQMVDEQLGAGEAMQVQDLNDQMQGARLANRRTMSARGLLGGSVDADFRGRNAAEYIGGRQKIAADKIMGKTQANQALISRRQDLEGLVRSGGLADIDSQTMRAEEDMRLSSGLNQAAPQELGDLFTRAGGIFEASQEVRRRPSVPRSTSSATSGAGTTTKNK